jgi:hypothetical protein
MGKLSSSGQGILDLDQDSRTAIPGSKQPVAPSGMTRSKRPRGPDTVQEGLTQDPLRVRNVWDECQAHRERNAIYSYLTAVYDLGAWWTAEDCAVERARMALRSQNVGSSDHDTQYFVPGSS